MKKSLFATILILLIAVFAFSLTACNKEGNTLDALENEYGVTVTGGGFTEGAILTCRQVEATSDEGINILYGIEEQKYDKEADVYIFEIYVTQDGQRVQPTETVEVSLPRPAPVSTLRQYLLFQLDETGGCSEIMNPRFTKENIVFRTHRLSYFVIAQKEHEHSYNRVEGTEATCTETGTAAHYYCKECGKRFNDNYVEVESVVIDKLPHDIEGNYSPRVEPTFLTAGNIAYYICNDCFSCIGEDGQIISSEDILIPALSPDISIYVNGVPTRLMIQNEFNIGANEWKLTGLSVSVGDVITVRPTDDSGICIYFTCDGDVIDRNVSATANQVVVTASCENTSVDFFTDGNGAQHLVMIDPSNCVHNYEWVEGTESTCTKAGTVAHYCCLNCGSYADENYGRLESIALPKAEHQYGYMYYEVLPSFFSDGNIAYYQCEACGKYFDEEYNEVESIVIPKYSSNISICVNGVPTALVFADQYEGHIIWTLDELTLKEGDVITVCQTDNPDICHSFSSFGIIDQNGKITMTAVAKVVAEATYNGIMLSINYIYEKTYEHYVNHIGVKSYDMALDESNPNVVFVKDVALPAGSEVKIHALLLPTIQDLSYIGATLVNTDQSIAVKQNGYFEILIDGTFDFYFDFEKNELTIVEGNDYEYYLNHIGVKSYDMIPYEYNPNVVFLESVTFDAGTEIKIQAKKFSTNQNISYFPSLFDTDQSIAVKQDGYVEILKSGTFDFYFDFVNNQLAIVESN